MKNEKATANRYVLSWPELKEKLGLEGNLHKIFIKESDKSGATICIITSDVEHLDFIPPTARPEFNESTSKLAIAKTEE